MEEVEARMREAPQALDYHLGVLKDFATYCSFELGIEQVCNGQRVAKGLIVAIATMQKGWHCN